MPMAEANGNGSAPTEAEAIVQGKVTGIIYPPPDIRAIVDKTAQFVANNGRAFESRIIGERMSAKFSFLRESDPYHAYYEHKVREFIEQKTATKEEEEEKKEQSQERSAAASSDESAKATPETPEDKEATVAKAAAESGDVVVEKQAVQDVTAKVAKKIKEKALEPPDEDVFTIKHPSQLSALDQEVMYLTAQYTAMSGKAFLSGLATREQRNPQFDFLKPTHPLFAYFTSLVESYALVAAKAAKQMKRIEDGMERMKVLDRCVHKLEWVRTEQERKAKEAAESDAERMALAQIDWYDFVVVETITFDDDDDEQAAAVTADTEAAKGSDDEDMDMDMDDDDDDEPKPELKVVENYVPQAAPATSQPAQLMSVDGKTVSTAEANEHMRILLMNPKWREETQRHLEKQKESSYAAGSAIADSLRRFATKRADIFSSSAEEEARLLQATSAPPKSAGNGAGTHDATQEEDMDEDEQQQDSAANGAASMEIAPAGGPPTAVGGYPGVPPLVPPPFVPGVSAPFGAPSAPPNMAGMRPPGMPPAFGGPPGMGAPLGVAVHPGMRGMGPSGYAPPPPPGVPGMPGVQPGFPPGVSGPPGVPPGVIPGPPGVNMGPPGTAMSGPPGVAPGTGAPSALQDADITDNGERAAKRQRTDAPSLLTEDEFAALHPGNVRLVIKVPEDPDNSQWKLEGQSLMVEVDIKATMRTVKEHIMKQLEGMPLNKQQLKASVGFVKDSLTCAHYNFVNGTVLELSVRQRGGRR